MSDFAPGQVRITEPSSSTEALCMVSATKIVGAPAVRVGNISGYVRVDYLTVNYAWRTQLGHDSWTIGNIDLVGPLVTADGDVDETHPGYQRITLVLGMHNAPDWIRLFAQARTPRSTLVIGAPGDPRTGTVEHARDREPAGVGGVAIGHVSSTTEIRHCLYRMDVTGAPRATLPGYGPGKPDRYITPDSLTVDYHWRGDHRPAVWRVSEIATDGPYVAADGSPLPGRAALPFAPAWATDYARAHLPTHIRLTEGETVTHRPGRERTQ